MGEIAQWHYRLERWLSGFDGASAHCSCEEALWGLYMWERVMHLAPMEFTDMFHSHSKWHLVWRLQAAGVWPQGHARDVTWGIPRISQCAVGMGDHPSNNKIDTSPQWGPPIRFLIFLSSTPSWPLKSWRGQPIWCSIFLSPACNHWRTNPFSHQELLILRVAFVVKTSFYPVALLAILLINTMACLRFENWEKVPEMPKWDDLSWEK